MARVSLKADIDERSDEAARDPTLPHVPSSVPKHQERVLNMWGAFYRVDAPTPKQLRSIARLAAKTRR